MISREGDLAKHQAVGHTKGQRRHSLQVNETWNYRSVLFLRLGNKSVRPYEQKPAIEHVKENGKEVKSSNAHVAKDPSFVYVTAI